MRIGILGGTFDPIHIGHLIAASEVHRALNLDRVLFIPAGQPWQKSEQLVSPASDRLAMVSLAIADDDRFDVSDMEIARPGDTYAIDTVHSLQKVSPDDEFFWIVGDDVLARIPTWHRWEEFVDSVTVVAVNRVGAPHVSVNFDYQRVEMPDVAVSATLLRQRLASADECLYLVPRDVAKYAITNGLYSL